MTSVEQNEAVPQDADNVTSAKRKSAMDEIEVDLTLPEPPSKRARRALKKGKPILAKNDSGDEKKKRADGDGEQNDEKAKARSEHAIWVGNLPFAVTAAELRQWLVDNAGGVLTDESITRIKMPTAKDPGRDKSQRPANKGFAYVDFADVGGKVAAIALTETELGHRKLLIKDARSFQGRPAKEKEPWAVETGPDGKVKHGAEQNKDVDPNASRKIFVGNLSFKTTEEDVRRNFDKCGEIDWVKVATFEDTGKCKGYGWVKFKEPEAAAWAVKGFVKVKEAVETEEDFKEGDETDDKKQDQQKQFKTRKWWVNRMLGRELKLELAEDDQSRYKKRFGKDAQRQANGGERKGVSSQGRSSSRPRDEAASDDPGAKSDASDKKTKLLKEAADIQIARLTGRKVDYTGTKVNFN
ncbi:Nucleotide-binding, alpha-beta plait [Metarhizium album ARSEF 1941]|uniref:Nucleotide-binding, alpha-beta plait n=1 Tax=Metarhizium album (strain ARSEF 1941) TaxID=1081103 RepID=A0A0B2WTJ6_METAS|nr:Nucleotide-binding, alpha-beta plait [Metarhizium album ARSEF 1941]KHN99401.1 Nucleotide-binding, alpha-beta plait [Metarhizium album ARSEF 1941]